MAAFEQKHNQERLTLHGAFSAYGTARSTTSRVNHSVWTSCSRSTPYWRASLYLCIGMLYLKASMPWLREPLSLEHTKPRLLSHWSSDPVQCFTYVHFNRLTNKYDLNALYLSGPGRGAPAVPNVSPGSALSRATSLCSRTDNVSPASRGTIGIELSAGRRTAFPARYGHFAAFLSHYYELPAVRVWNGPCRLQDGATMSEVAQSCPRPGSSRPVRLWPDPVLRPGRRLVRAAPAF